MRFAKTEGGDVEPCALDARWRREVASTARTSPRLFGASGGMRSCSLRKPRDLLRRRRAGRSNSVPGHCGFKGPAAIVLAQSHSASRFGLDPMRPSDETERRHSTTALEVLDCEEGESQDSKHLRKKSVGYAVRFWPIADTTKSAILTNEQVRLDRRRILSGVAVGVLGGALGGVWFMPSVVLNMGMTITGSLLSLINIRMRDRDEGRR